MVLANSFRSFELVKVAIYHKTVYSSASLRKIASFILLLIAAGCRDHRCSNIVVSVINLIFFNQMKANVDCSCCSRNIVKSIHQNCCAHRFWTCLLAERADVDIKVFMSHIHTRPTYVLRYVLYVLYIAEHAGAVGMLCWPSVISFAV